MPRAGIIIQQIFHKSGADERRERSPIPFSLSSLLPFACVSFFFLFSPDYEKVSGKFLSACFVSIDRTTVHNIKKIPALMNFS